MAKKGQTIQYFIEEFKQKAVKEYLSGEGSYNSMVILLKLLSLFI